MSNLTTLLMAVFSLILFKNFESSKNVSTAIKAKIQFNPTMT